MTLFRKDISKRYNKPLVRFNQVEQQKKIKFRQTRSMSTTPPGVVCTSFTLVTAARVNLATRLTLAAVSLELKDYIRDNPDREAPVDTCQTLVEFLQRAEANSLLSSNVLQRVTPDLANTISMDPAITDLVTYSLF